MKFITICFLLLTSFTIQAQEWSTDINEAQKIAIQENKKIVLVFQGSDWCAPCIKLHKNVWETTYFKEYQEKNYVMVKVDFPRRKKNRLPKEQQEKNAILFEKYNPQGIFPFVVVLDADKNILKTAGYKKMKAEDYISYLNN